MLPYARPSRTGGRVSEGLGKTEMLKTETLKEGMDSNPRIFGGFGQGGWWLQPDSWKKHIGA